jgi:ABC-2 type transport system permease protein
MNRVLLGMVMLFSGLWRSMGADIVQLKAILNVKLKIDDRKPLMFGKRQQKKNSRFSSATNMLLSFFMGFAYVLPLLGFKDDLFALFSYFTVFIFFLCFSLITDFSSVIADTRDKYILFPRPVNDRTVFLSRMIYVVIYLFRVVIPMSLPGWIIIGIGKGWKAALLFPLPLICMVFMTLFLVNGLYLLILKFSKPGSFQNIINSFQIIFTILVIVFYYGMQGAMKNAALETVTPAAYPWMLYTPPYWLAACWTWVGFKAALPYTKLASTLAVLVPLGSLWVTVRWLAPSFTRKLAAMDGLDVTEHTVTRKGKTTARQFYRKLSNLVNQGSDARAGFMITWLQTARSRSFKMRVYPSLVYAPVMFFYSLIMSDGGFVHAWEGLADSQMHLFLLYMSSFSLLQAMSYVTMSDQYKAAWIYHSAPVETPGDVIMGSFKALWLKFFLPFMGLIGVFVVWIWGPGALLDVVLATVNVSLFSLAVMRISYRAFPFSMMEQMKQTAGKTMLRIFGALILVGVLGFGHYAASVFWWLKLLLLILSLIFSWLVWDSVRNTTWAKLKVAEETT